MLTFSLIVLLEFATEHKDLSSVIERMCVYRVMTYEVLISLLNIVIII